MVSGFGDVGIGTARKALPDPVHGGLGRAVRTVAYGSEGFLELGVQRLAFVFEVLLGDDAPLDQPLFVAFADRLAALDAPIHLGLGERGLVALVVSELAVADQVDDDVGLELLTVLDRELGRVGGGLGVVAVDVKDRRVEHVRDCRGVDRGARVMGVGGEADLVVDDDADGALVAVPLEVDRG